MPEEYPVDMTIDDARILAETIRAMRNVRGAGGITVTWTPGGGLTISGPGKGRPQPAGTLIKRMVVKSIENDYLVCRALDGDDTETAQDIAVAKQPELRHHKDYYPNVSVLTTIDEQEVTVTVSGEAETWILPSELEYVANTTHILAARVGKTGVQTDDDPAEEIYWMDLNGAGRVWIKDES